jgi:hypothetical protein
MALRFCTIVVEASWGNADPLNRASFQTAKQRCRKQPRAKISAENCRRFRSAPMETLAFIAKVADGILILDLNEVKVGRNR